MDHPHDQNDPNASNLHAHHGSGNTVPIAAARQESRTSEDTLSSSSSQAPGNKIGFPSINDRARHGSSNMGLPTHTTPRGPSYPEGPADASRDKEPVVLKGPSCFPNFHDGDVLITSPTGRTWKLHSMVLSNASKRFRELFNETPPIKVTKAAAVEGNLTRWSLLMYPEPAAHALDPNGLQFKNFKVIGDKRKHTLSLPQNMNGLGVKESYNKLYDNFFRCIYNLEPIFANDIEGPSEGKQFILDASTLLQAAVFLDAVPAVRVIIEAHLLRLNQLLWHHISNRPEGWVHLAARLQSPLMFREAMLHIVGKFHLPNGIDEEMLRRPAFGYAGIQIWELIQKKARELKQTKLYIERHLLEYYPARMVHKEDEGDFIPGRATYANDIYLWMALSLFRQYVSSAYLSNYHHRASDGGLSFYRTLGAADATYLRTDTLQRFHGSFDMSSKGKACLSLAVESIKADVKPIVERLLIDRSQATRDLTAPRLGHLTCTEILDHELPWYTPPQPPPNADADVMMDGGI